MFLIFLLNPHLLNPQFKPTWLLGCSRFRLLQVEYRDCILLMMSIFFIDVTSFVYLAYIPEHSLQLRKC